MISTTAESKPEDKKENLKKLREFHQPTLVALGIPDVKIIPKLFYVPTKDKPGETELHISFFLSELKDGDVYMEACNRENVPEDEERTLYKWRFNPHYDDEYTKTAPHDTTGHIRYLVPVGELVIIKKYKKDTNSAPLEVKLNVADPDTDLPLDQLTIRDIAAIVWKKPISNKKFINNLINNNK